MIILDTNVISEPLRAQPSAVVIEWLDAQAIETLFLTTITVAEIRYGIAKLPNGRRKQTLQSRMNDEVLELFAGRILPFDEAAAESFGELRASAARRGHSLGELDVMIAAIAQSRRFTVATRDTSPFEGAGVSVINPFGG